MDAQQYAVRERGLRCELATQVRERVAQEVRAAQARTATEERAAREREQTVWVPAAQRLAQHKGGVRGEATAAGALAGALEPAQLWKAMRQNDNAPQAGAMEQAAWEEVAGRRRTGQSRAQQADVEHRGRAQLRALNRELEEEMGKGVHCDFRYVVHPP